MNSERIVTVVDRDKLEEIFRKYNFNDFQWLRTEDITFWFMSPGKSEKPEYV